MLSPRQSLCVKKRINISSERPHREATMWIPRISAIQSSLPRCACKPLIPHKFFSKHYNLKHPPDSSCLAALRTCKVSTKSHRSKTKRSRPCLSHSNNNIAKSKLKPLWAARSNVGGSSDGQGDDSSSSSLVSYSANLVALFSKESTNIRKRRQHSGKNGLASISSIGIPCTCAAC